jgi:hypothetical protein
MARLQEKYNGLKKIVEEGGEINPEEFIVEIANSTEDILCLRLYGLLDKKIPTLPKERRLLYQRAQENLFRASLEYLKRR